MLTTEAWNAFLKTLEEPPGHVLFILCTTEPHKVPDTVRSRVQRFDFGRVSSARIDEHLRAIATAEAVDLEPAAARLIARAAQGSVRDGLSLLDQCFATGDRPVTLQTCRRALGLAHPDVIRALLEGLAVRDAAAALRAAGAAFDAGADPRQLLRECSRLARAAELVAVGFAEGVRLEADEDELCRRLAAQEPGGFWLRVLEEMGAAELELRQPVDARLQVEACLLRLCRGGFAGGGEERLDRLEARLGELEEHLGSGSGARVARPEGRPPAGPTAAPAPAAPVHRTARTAPEPSRTVTEAGRSGSSASATSTTPTTPATRVGPAADPAPRVAGAEPAGQPPGEARPSAAPDLEPAGVVPAEPPGAVSAGPAEALVADPTGGVAGTEAAVVPPPPGSLVTLEAWQAAWPALIEAVNRRDRVFAGVLRGCRPLDAGPDRLVVGAPYDFHLKQLGNPVKRPILASAVEAVAGGPRELAVEFCGTSATPPGGVAADAGAKLTDAVVATFAGSRITSTRLVDHTHDPVDEG